MPIYTVSLISRVTICIFELSAQLVVIECTLVAKKNNQSKIFNTIFSQ